MVALLTGCLIGMGEPKRALSLSSTLNFTRYNSNCYHETALKTQCWDFLQLNHFVFIFLISSLLASAWRGLRMDSEAFAEDLSLYLHPLDCIKNICLKINVKQSRPEFRRGITLTFCKALKASVQPWLSRYWTLDLHLLFLNGGTLRFTQFRPSALLFIT